MHAGGSVIYATQDGFIAPPRTPGSYTIHDCHVPHGVTALTRGLRYSLFLQTAPPTLSLSASPAAA